MEAQRERLGEAEKEIKKQLAGHPGVSRLREHVEMATTEEMAVLGRLGVTASMQPMFDAYWGGAESLYAQRLGAERALPMNAFASMARAGIPLAFGSDTPVTPYDPWGAIRAWVNHHDSAQRTSVRNAMGSHSGSLILGQSESYAVWEVPGGLVDGLPDLSPGRPQPICLRTVVRGNLAYQREGALA